MLWKGIDEMLLLQMRSSAVGLLVLSGNLLAGH